MPRLLRWVVLAAATLGPLDGNVCSEDITSEWHEAWTSGVRVGEASNPGPAPQLYNIADIDDPEGELFSQSQSYAALDASYHDIGYAGDDCGNVQQPQNNEIGATDSQWDDYFKAASSFNGAMPGWHFKLGDKGLGYYCEEPSCISIDQELHPTLGVTPLRLRLDSLSQRVDQHCQWSRVYDPADISPYNHDINMKL